MTCNMYPGNMVKTMEKWNLHMDIRLLGMVVRMVKGKEWSHLTGIRYRLVSPVLVGFYG